MTDYKYTPNTTAQGQEWDVHGVQGVREIYLDYEYPDGYMGGTSRGCLFLNREDLLAMLAALDSEDA